MSIQQDTYVDHNDANYFAAHQLFRFGHEGLRYKINSKNRKC